MEWKTNHSLIFSSIIGFSIKQKKHFLKESTIKGKLNLTVFAIENNYLVVC
jgi:hypothetical protein